MTKSEQHKEHPAHWEKLIQTQLLIHFNQQSSCFVRVL